ncbi:pre-mRNA-splicing factor SLU7, partial [Brachionus plicatilis]
MSQQHFSEPPSVLARRKDGDGPRKQTREEYRQQKELEELRKAGNAPAEVDESGRDINPHIPKYMVDVPWYVTYDHAKPTLKHQRYHDEKKEKFDGMEKWYARGQDSKIPSTFKYRPGACENCGAMGHKRKDCLEKPRKRLAKYGGSVIASDDTQQPELRLNFDGKRDRWNGIDLDRHQEKIRSEFEKLEEARRMIKSKQLEEESKDLEEHGESSPAAKRELDSDDEEEDEDKYADEMNLPQKLHLESKKKISVRNLRMREDTAKYLLNLDPNSAYYDPKSRSMRDNPFKEKQEVIITPYIGDNYVRYSGEVSQFAKSQMFAWEAAEKGVEVHQQAEPTKLELLHKEFNQRYEECAKNIKNSVLEKYGGAEHLEAMPKELIFAQTENYVEYNRYGNVVKTLEKATVKSKYVEDEFVHSHTSVWGSYYKDDKWGYKCCQSTDRNSYCTSGVTVSAK